MMAEFRFAEIQRKERKKPPLGSDKGVKAKANETEKTQAKKLGAFKTPVSGAIDGLKGDYVVDDFLFDSKETSKASISLSVKDFAKVTREAHQAGKHPALTLKVPLVPGTVSQEWVAIPLDVFSEMLEKYGL